MNEELIFFIYMASLLLIAYSVIRQSFILLQSENGTRFTQKTFLLFNLCFFFFVLGKLFELAGFSLPYPDEIRAMLLLVMASVGFVFYSQGRKK